MEIMPRTSARDFATGSRSPLAVDTVQLIVDIPGTTASYLCYNPQRQGLPVISEGMGGRPVAKSSGKKTGKGGKK